MRDIFREPLCITGTFVEKNTKSVLTILMAAAYALLLSTIMVRATNLVFYYIYLTAGIEIFAIALLCILRRPTAAGAVANGS